MDIGEILKNIWNGSGYQALASRTYYWVAFGTV